MPEGTAQLGRSVAYTHSSYALSVLYTQVKARRAAGHGGRRATAEHGGPRRGTAGRRGRILLYAMECRGLCPLPVPLPFPTITGVREWRIGGEGEERKEYQQLAPVLPQFASSDPTYTRGLGVYLENLSLACCVLHRYI